MSQINDSRCCGNALNGVCCDVSECAFNNKHRCCTASSIEVSSDGTGSHTFCATFRKD